MKVYLRVRTIESMYPQATGEIAIECSMTGAAMKSAIKSFLGSVTDTTWHELVEELTPGYKLVADEDEPGDPCNTCVEYCESCIGSIGAKLPEQSKQAATSKPATATKPIGNGTQGHANTAAAATTTADPFGGSDDLFGG